MYVPTFTLTQTIVQNIVAYELAIHDLKTQPTSVKLQRTLTSALGQSTTQKFGEILGMHISDDSALDLYLGKEMPMPGSQHLVLSNYRSVMDYIYSSAKDPYATLSPALLLHINKLLLNEVLESWEHGRFRSLSDSANSVCDPWLSTLKPAPISEDPHRFFLELLQWYSDRKFTFHPLFRTSILIYEILRLYPFLSGNFLTALAIGELVTERSKYSLRGIQLISRTFLFHNQELLDAFSRTIEAQNDVTYWVDSFVKAVSVESAAIRNAAVKISDRKLHTSKDVLEELNSRQLKLIHYFRYHPRINRKQYVAQSGVSTMTAYRDLNDLVKRKIILLKGGGRSTYYVLRQESDELEERLEEIHPNKDAIKVIRDSEFPSDRSETFQYPSESGGNLFD